MKSPSTLSYFFFFLSIAMVLLSWTVFSFRIGQQEGWSKSKSLRFAGFILLALLLWGAFTAWLASSGILANFKRMPPNFMFFVLGMVVFCVALTFSRFGELLLKHIGLSSLIMMQIFRLVVELYLHSLYKDGVIPFQMTYVGYNFDIVVALTAPICAWLLTTKKIGKLGCLVWNSLSLGLLLNIMTIGILSAPTPFRYFLNEPSNTIILKVPFVWLPALLVSTALFSHMLIFRGIFQMDWKKEEPRL